MTTPTGTLLGAALLLSMQWTTGASQSPIAGASGAPALDADRALVRQYCVGCHSDTAKAGGLSLVGFDPARVDQHAAVAEKVIRKLRAGMMPPAAARRPDAGTMRVFVAALEARLDAAAAARPNPGRRPFQRLNRAEYARAIRDLLDLEVDVDAFLPTDTISSGFDNIADVQSLSPTLMLGYLRAASQIARLAIGDGTARPSPATFQVLRTEGQMRHVEGTPIGTRGGLAVSHVFPADGDYVFKLTFFSGGTGELFGGTTIASTDRGEQIEISINGVRAAIFDIDGWMDESDPNGLTLRTGPLQVNAGPQRVSAAFVKRYAGPVDDLLAPHEYTDADPRIGIGYGITTLPHLREATITGPERATGVSETPSRRRIFTCRPAAPRDDTTCATAIVTRLATQAYRLPVRPKDLDILMRLYAQEREKHGFEAGVRLALQGILTSPRFVFRLEETPDSGLTAGQPFRIGEFDLASRLSFFLWGTVPDAELLKTAADGTLRKPAVLETQVRRLLADRRSEALSTRFASQWLRLQDVEKISPDALRYPHYDHFLSTSYVRETTLFFDSLVREDRSVLDLLTADYSFVNDRIARQYGIPNVSGHEFRRVPLPPERRGILGHGSILLLTSVSDRTSPVQRGKWIMEVLLGSPPPPPPADVPAFEETQGAKDGRLLTTRERMEEHRANPACSSCHRVIDPPGLALENFDVTGTWRIKDNGVAIDARGQLYDGTPMDGPLGLRDALLKHTDIVLATFAENLMTYALGRRLEYYDMPAVRAILREAERHDHRVSSFVLGIALSAPFQMSHIETAATDTPPRQH